MFLPVDFCFVVTLSVLVFLTVTCLMLTVKKVMREYGVIV